MSERKGKGWFPYCYQWYIRDYNNRLFYTPSLSSYSRIANTPFNRTIRKKSSSPLYYAATNGDALTVNVYLSVYHINVYSTGKSETEHHRTYRNIYVEHTRKKHYVQTYDGRKKHDVQSYDDIIRDSTDDEVLQILSKRKYSIGDSIKFVKSWLSVVDGRGHDSHTVIYKLIHKKIQSLSVKEKKKSSASSKKASLNAYNDYGDCDNYDDDTVDYDDSYEPFEENDNDHDTTCVDWRHDDDEAEEKNDLAFDDEDTFHERLEENFMTDSIEDDRKESTIQGVNENDVDSTTLDFFDDEGLVTNEDTGEDKVIIENTSVLSFDSNFSEADEFSAVLKEKETDPSCDGDWDLLSNAQSLKNNDSVFSQSDGDWDALSSMMRSVQSIDTFRSEVKIPSYKDMVAKKGTSVHSGFGGNSGVQSVNEQLLKKEDVGVCQQSSMPPIVEGSCYDENDERDGYKYGRGGKNAYQFRGENNSIKKKKKKKKKSR